MPNLESAVKRARLSEAARHYNRAIRSRISTARRRVMDATAGTDLEQAHQTYRSYCSTLDKAAKRGVIKKNTAIRRKRRAAAKLATAASSG